MTLYFLCLIHTQTDILKQKFVISGEFIYWSFFLYKQHFIALPSTSQVLVYSRCQICQPHYDNKTSGRKDTDSNS